MKKDEVDMTERVKSKIGRKNVTKGEEIRGINLVERIKMKTGGNYEGKKSG